MLQQIEHSMETNLFNQRHTKAVLENERMIVNRKVADVKGENAQMSREISRNKMFNKKDEERKEKKERQDKINTAIKEFNKEIEEHDILLDREKRRLEDKNLVKKQLEIVRQLQ